MKDTDCREWRGVKNAARQIGDPWSLLIVWEALHGTTRFVQFHTRLGLGRTILSNRLSELVDADILVRCPIQPGARKFEYRITRKGEALRPALELIEAWGRNEPIDGQLLRKLLKRTMAPPLDAVRLRPTSPERG